MLSLLSLLTSANMATEPWKTRVSALFRQHRCTAAYLDVGTNVGVQLRKLFEPHRFEGAPVLPVFSAAFGENRCRVCAVGVEPNPRHARRLDEIESKLTAAGFGVLVLRGAATTKESTVQLALPAKGWMEGIDIDARLGGMEAPQQRNAFAARGAKLVNVTGFDLAAVIRLVHAHLPEPHQLLMKVDVEGHEYELLPRLVSTGALCLATKLFLEWHPQSTSLPPGQVRAVTRMTRRTLGGDQCATQLLDLDDESFMHAATPWPSHRVCAMGSVLLVPDSGTADNANRRILSQKQVGFCAETAYPSREGDCLNGWSGSWDPKKHAITSLWRCAKMCRRRCPACQYVSYSKDDCSWFRECSLPLQQAPLGYATIAVNNRSLAGGTVTP